MTVRLMERTTPLKPAKSGAEANEFFEREAFRKLEGKFYVEPKYDGIRVQAHRKGSELKIFTDEGNEIQQKLPSISSEFLSFPGSTFILDGELVKYEDSRLLPHEAVVSLLHKGEGEVDEEGLRFKFFDILWIGGRATIDLPLKERKKLLDQFPDTEHIHQVKYIEADSGDEVVKAIASVESHEGAVVKDIESTYTKEQAKRWYKFKNQREIDAEVMEIEKTPRGAFIYTCAILDKEGRKVPIGKTLATSLQVKEGDIIRVSVDRVSVKDGKPSWLIPKVLELRTEKKEPDTMAVVEKLSHSTVWDAILMARRGGEFVLQRHWWGEASHHDLRLTKRHGWFGFTIPQGESEELKHRLDEGGKLLCFKKAYYGGMEWMEYGKKGIKVIPEGADYHGMKGNPSKQYKAYLQAVDWGEYTLEQRTETEFIISFVSVRSPDLTVLSGRYFIILAPDSMQEKGKPEKWLMSKAKEEQNVALRFTGAEKEEKEPVIENLQNDHVILSEAKDFNEASLLDEPHHIIEVTIIKPGPAKVSLRAGGEAIPRQVVYSEESLKKSLPLWEGAACFCDHFNKSVRNIAGVYFSPWYDNGVKAKLRFIDDTLYHMVTRIISDREQSLSVPDIGISADISIKGIPRDHTIEVEEITNVISADIVFSPAAGGSFDRVLNAVREKLGIPNALPVHPEPVEGSQKRIRDLQSTSDKLRAQVKNQEAVIASKSEAITQLTSDLSLAVTRYREGILQKHPEIPEVMVTGTTLAELDASLEKAKAVVETVKKHLEADFFGSPGAPIRSSIDVESLSPTEKIKYGLGKRT